MIQRPTRIATALALVFAFTQTHTASAEDSPWLPLRDQNPFVLGSGLPLLPQPALTAGRWSVDASLTESNSQLISSVHGQFSGDPGLHVTFGAETRETRVTVAYALNNDWSVRASLGDEWIGVGFLNEPIKKFHNLIDAPQGYRKHGLGVPLPYISVTNQDQVLYQLDHPAQAVAPLLLDLTRTWAPSDSSHYGLSLGAKLPTGDTERLSDTGDTGISASAFGDWRVTEYIQVGARLGYLHVNGNDVLPTMAKSSIAFGDLYIRVPLSERWNVMFQYDAHSALYRDAPIFLSYAGQASLGLTRRIGTHSELTFSISEDVPLAHTQDVSLMAAWRYRPGD